MHRANNDKIHHDIQAAEQAFNKRLNEAIERALQEILLTADEATDNINAQADHIILQTQLNDTATQSNKQHSWKDTTPKPSKLFPNVDVSQFCSSAHQHEETVYPSMDHSSGYNIYLDRDAELPWNKNGPAVDNVLRHVEMTSDVLPMVNHHDFLKRVFLPYPGREQSYIWYLQLRSNAYQYGVYLIATEEFKQNKSLCPREVSGHKITAGQYDTMKCTVYHFLAQRTIITPDYTDLRNIINRQAISTDGYQVLYDIMQRVHPKLNTDVTFLYHSPPTTVIYMSISLSLRLT